MNILYLGPTSRATTSGHRAHALQRLGHTVAGVNITSSFNFNRLESKIHYITGYRFIQGCVFDALNTSLEELSFACDLIWIDGGQYFGAQVLAWLKKAFRAPIVLYNVDDPTGPRDACSFHTLKRSFCHYSLCVFVRQESSLEALALGAKRVVTVSRSFDEVEHLEASLDTCVNDEVHSLSFLGTNIPGEKRDVFLVNLLRDGVPLRIFGDLYERSRFWDEIKPFHQKHAINSDYVSLIQESFACLGLLSHQNRDLITTRSLEIPACSGIFCAECSSEHQLLYENQVEAVFWSHPREIPRLFRRLENPELRSSIKAASRARILELGFGNEDICRYILSLL